MKGTSQQRTPPRLVWLGIFGIAMGLLEAIVVMYLRELYFPGGFRFPLQLMPQQAFNAEVLREICTIVMLIALAAVAGKTFIVRFSIFLFVFGVWDIFYYLSLKVLLGWPESFFTWDVLFLIPLTWLGPVLAPVICSLTMIGLGLLCAFLYRQYGTVRWERPSWVLLGAGAAIIFLTFIWDHASIIMRGGFFRDIAHLAENRAFQAAVVSYVPGKYHWGLFGIGEALILSAGAIAYRKTALSGDGGGRGHKGSQG